jgi:hypothetical protein
MQAAETRAVPLMVSFMLASEEHYSYKCIGGVI